jgi:hypothetical protein
MLTREEARRELSLFYIYTFTYIFVIFSAMGLKIYLYINQL